MHPHLGGRGLTLIEIIVALAVLTVLSAIALPGFGARLERERLHGAAEALAADVNEARFEAVRQGRPLHVSASQGPAWCWAVTTDPDCPCGSGQACQLRSAREHDHPGVTLRSTGQVELGADGRATMPVSSFELESRHGMRLRVSVGTMGRAHVCTLRNGAPAATWRHPPCS
jgi:type IV fimbrial biogenesis protein FimT